MKKKIKVQKTKAEIETEERKKVYWGMRNAGAYTTKLDDGRWAIYMAEGVYWYSDGSEYIV